MCCVASEGRKGGNLALPAFRISMSRIRPLTSWPPRLGRSEMLWLTIPMTSPAMLNIGPPEFPVLMVASVGKNSAKGKAGYTLFGGQRALI